MSKPVLFVSGLGSSPERSENIKAIFDAYQGDKSLVCGHMGQIEAESGRYDLMVIDVFPTYSPGKCIMIWHAIQGGKYIGLDQKGSYYRPEYARFIDRIVAAGRGGVKMMAQCTGVPEEKVLNLGMPRTDRYIGKRKGDGHIIMTDRKVYLYVPTFRGRSDPPMPDVDFDLIDRLLMDDEVMVVKPHPYGQKMWLSGYKHIVEANKMAPSVNYLYDCDVVITDYSSIIFDGYLLNKPAVLFEKEKGYVQNRGMYLHYPDGYCSRYAKTEKELIRKIRTADKLTIKEELVKDFVAGACDGHSCERICKLIEEMR